jgi:hypothetical protein
MRFFPRLFLSAGILLTALSAGADDQLPMLQATGAANLPSLSSVSSSSLNMAPVSDQAFSVTCYLGNPNDGQTLNSITVYSPSEAGTSCNSLNYACRGRCFGCYSDFDLSEDICVDASGRKYLR